jgi:hypothetical protein
MNWNQIQKLQQEYPQRIQKIKSILSDSNNVTRLFVKHSTSIVPKLKQDSSIAYVLFLFESTSALLRHLEGSENPTDYPKTFEFLTLEQAKHINPNSKVLKDCEALKDQGFCVGIGTILPLINAIEYFSTTCLKRSVFLQ